MKALSLWQPWAWAMTVPPPPRRKGVENRTWPCPPAMIGKRFAVHAAKTWDPKGVAFIASNGLVVPRREDVALGAVVALATIKRQVTAHAELPADQQCWFFGPFGYVFADVELLEVAVPCRGFQMFFELPAAVADAVEQQRTVDAGNRHFRQGAYAAQRADELVRRMGPALLGRALITPAMGDWEGGDSMVLDLGHDPAAPEIVLNVRRLSDGAEIGVFGKEEVRLLGSSERPQ